MMVTVAIPVASPHVALILASPGAIAVSSPVCALIVAISGVEHVQINVLSVVLSGATIAESVNLSPTYIFVSGTLIVTVAAGTGFTVTLHVAETSPHLAVMLATPTETPVTVPSAATVAIASLSDAHVTVLSEVFSGNTVAVSFSV